MTSLFSFCSLCREYEDNDMCARDILRNRQSLTFLYSRANMSWKAISQNWHCQDNNSSNESAWNYGTNETKAEYQTPYSSQLTVMIAVFLAVCALLSVGGNLLVLLAFVVDRTIRQPSNYFIASLATSDLFIGLLSLPFYAVYELRGTWELGSVPCNWWLAVDYSVCLVSIYNVLVITTDRYCTLRFAFKYRAWRTKNKALTMILFTWIIPLILVFVSVMGWEHFTGYQNLHEGKCSVQFRKDPIFNTTFVVCHFWCPLILMFVFYGRMYKIAEDKQNRSKAKQRMIKDIIGISLINYKSDPASPSHEESRRAVNSDQSTACSVPNEAAAGNDTEMTGFDGTIPTKDPVNDIEQSSRQRTDLSQDPVLPPMLQLYEKAKGNKWKTLCRDVTASAFLRRLLATMQPFSRKITSAEPILIRWDPLPLDHQQFDGICVAEQKHGGTGNCGVPRINRENSSIYSKHQLKSVKPVSDTPHSWCSKKPFLKTVESSATFSTCQDMDGLESLTWCSIDVTSLRIPACDSITSCVLEERHQFPYKSSSLHSSFRTPSVSNVEGAIKGAMVTTVSSAVAMVAVHLASTFKGRVFRLAKAEHQQPIVSNSKYRNRADSKAARMLSSSIGKSVNMKRRCRLGEQNSKSAYRISKALRTITFILGAFVICWTPFHILTLMEGFCKYGGECTNHHLLYFTYFLCYINSLVNPFCYAFASHRFTKTFVRILKGDLHKT